MRNNFNNMYMYIYIYTEKTNRVNLVIFWYDNQWLAEHILTRLASSSPITALILLSFNIHSRVVGDA